MAKAFDDVVGEIDDSKTNSEGLKWKILSVILDQ